MIRIILTADLIPNGTMVCKPTGTKLYKLVKEGLKVYGPDKREILFGDAFLLVADRASDSINIATKDQKLAVDFSHADRAYDFLRVVRDEQYSEQ